MYKLVFGMYKRKFLFFAAIIMVIGGFFYLASRQGSEASLKETGSITSPGVYDVNLEIKEDGKVFARGEETPEMIFYHKDYDEFRFKAFDQENYFVDEINITVKLPKEVVPSEIKQNIYAIHGVGSYEYKILDSKTLVYHGYNFSPSATFTVSAQLPKGLIKYPWSKSVIYSFNNVSATVWLIISLILPILTLGLLVIMMTKSLKDWKNNQPREFVKNPPNILSPAVAGVLLDGKVSARLLAATVLDLAYRGYIDIVERGKEFTFIKKTSLEKEYLDPRGLRTFEKTLLDKMFTSSSYRSTTEDIQVRIGRHIFSRKIAEIYLSLYEEVTARGFFYENPSSFHSRYYILGLISFFVGIAGFIFGIIFLPEPKLLLLVWFGMIISSLFITKLAPKLPTRTDFGQKESLNWLQFKNFLSGKGDLEYHEENQELFEKYLPYAISLGCEDEWASRFVGMPFRVPDWFISSKQTIILEDFFNNLLPIVSNISEQMAVAHEPIVD